jgi:hypothetical protein
MIDLPIFLMIVALGTAFGFGAGRMTARNESEEKVLRRIIDRKYAARVEREKVKVATDVKAEMDSFVRSLTKGASDVDNH